MGMPAGIRYFNNDKFAGFYGVGAELVGFKQCFGAGGDGQGAVVVHGVFGVNCQIDDDLRKLYRVDADIAELAAMVEIQGYLFAEDTFQHMAEFDKVFGDFYQLVFQRLFA